MKSPEEMRITTDRRLLLGHNHCPSERRAFVVHYLIGEYWTEAGTFTQEASAKVLMAHLLKKGDTVRLSKTFECIELGEPITPQQFRQEQAHQQKPSAELLMELKD